MSWLMESQRKFRSKLNRTLSTLTPAQLSKASRILAIFFDIIPKALSLILIKNEQQWHFHATQPYTMSPMHLWMALSLLWMSLRAIFAKHPSFRPPFKLILANIISLSAAVAMLSDDPLSRMNDAFSQTGMALASGAFVPDVNNVQRFRYDQSVTQVAKGFFWFLVISCALSALLILVAVITALMLRRSENVVVEQKKLMPIVLSAKKLRKPKWEDLWSDTLMNNRFNIFAATRYFLKTFQKI